MTTTDNETKPGREATREPTGKPKQVVPPALVGWDDQPPDSVTTRRNQWDEVLTAVRNADGDQWAKVRKPGQWHSSSLATLRKQNPDLEIISPMLERGPGRRATEFLWIRRRPQGSKEGE